MHRWLARLVRRIVFLVLLVVVAILGVRVWDVEGGPPLALWHTYMPHEMNRAAMATADWAAYGAAEDAVFAEVRRFVTDQLPPSDRVASNRYFTAARSIRPASARIGTAPSSSRPMASRPAPSCCCTG